MNEVPILELEATRRFVQVSLPVDDVAVAIARAMVRRVTTFASDDAESSFLIALTEVVSNAVDEHRDAGVVDPVVMTIDYESAEVVYVTDRGRGFDDRSMLPPTGMADVEETDQSGRGLALARAFVPGIKFDSDDSGTTVSLPMVGIGIVR